MMDWSDNGNWMNGWGMVLMVLMWVAVLAVAVFITVRVTRNNHVPASGASARELLDRRFATGELTAGEYASARETLDGRGRDAKTASG